MEMTKAQMAEQLGCSLEQIEELEQKHREAHERFLKEDEAVGKAMKFRKVKNEQRWNAQNGTTIYLNVVLGEYTINNGTRFAFAKTLDEAMTIARRYPFNR